MTMTLVSTVTVGSGGAASIEWTGIPATGTDLLVVLSLRLFTGATYVISPIKFNSSSTGFTNKELTGTGSSTFSGSGNRYVYGTTANGAAANTFSNVQIYIPNYAGSTNKSFSVESVTEDNATAVRLNLFAGLWSNTAAITSITIDGDGADFMQYSTASLYTITKGSGGATVS